MTQDLETPAVFEEFNAKYLDPEDVARNFVYSRHFQELSGAYHAVLVGPRGSGKTTLLKMLHPAALAVWRGRRADSFRRQISYSGVFIPSDISWSRQLTSLGYGRLSDNNHRILVLGCFTTHVLESVIETMIYRARHRRDHKLHLTSPDEEAIVTAIANVLKLTPEIASLLSLKQSLRARLTNIRILANRGSLLAQGDFARELAGADYLHLDFLDAATNITGIFSEVTGNRKERWALLFDELENAPDWIVEQLIYAFRVSDPKLYLKLAISPVSQTAFTALTSSVGPALGHDHRMIRLWYSDRVEAREFCTALWNLVSRKAGLTLSPTEALGASAFEPLDGITAARSSPYAKGQRWIRVFQELASKDRTFAAFLRARHVDLSGDATVDQHKRDTVLRKAAPVAAVRNFYLHESETGFVSSRFRKTSKLYAGAFSIFAITEGNPRWFIGVVSPLISYLVTQEARIVPEEVQADEIDSAADRLIALVRSIPVNTAVGPESVRSLDEILDRIGRRLHSNLMADNFTLDPKLSFVVDRQVPPYVRDLLATGLNRGAVMLVEDNVASAIIGNVDGAVIRLSYLLAAKYGLPLRRGKVTNLSYLLANQRKPDAARQLQLTGDDL